MKIVRYTLKEAYTNLNLTMFRSKCVTVFMGTIDIGQKIIFQNAQSYISTVVLAPNSSSDSVDMVDFTFI